MLDLVQNSATQTALFRTVILVVVSIVGFYIVQRVRDVADDTETTGDMLSNFREMEHQGDLSEAEFRTIKTVLAARMQSQINDEDQSG